MNTPEKNPAAVALGRLGGLAGKGKVKARTTEQARKAARARWDKAQSQLCADYAAHLDREIAKGRKEQTP